MWTISNVTSICLSARFLMSYVIALERISVQQMKLVHRKKKIEKHARTYTHTHTHTHTQIYKKIDNQTDIET